MDPKNKKKMQKPLHVLVHLYPPNPTQVCKALCQHI